MTDARQESGGHPIEHQEETLAELRRQIRTEGALLTELRADAERVEAAAAVSRKPIIGPAYVVGLVLGGPLWFLLILETVWR
jgi:hypothetical protein